MLEIAAHGGREGFAEGLGGPLGIFTEETWILKEERENATFTRERQRTRLCKAQRLGTRGMLREEVLVVERRPCPVWGKVWKAGP